MLSLTYATFDYFFFFLIMHESRDAPGVFSRKTSAGVLRFARIISPLWCLRIGICK